MEFVPINIAGVYRPLRFINELQKQGITPVVLTFEINDNLKKVQNKFDEDLVKLVDSSIPIIRIPLDDLSKLYSNKINSFFNIYFNLSDNFLKSWKENLYKILPQIILQYKPAAIITTCPPFSSAILGRDISKKYNLPLILDMRDAWAKLSIVPVGSYFHYLLKKRLEKSCFKQASYITTVTPQLLRQFKNTHKEFPEKKFQLIYNAFNFELQSQVQVTSSSIEIKELIHIGYIGSYYYTPIDSLSFSKGWSSKIDHRKLQYYPVKEDWSYRSPYYFFKVFKLVLQNNPKWEKKIIFHHVGEVPEWLIKMIQDLGLENNIVLHGFQPLEQTLHLQKSFDYLLATSEKVTNGEHYCLPSKLFTYLTTQKPILAFVTKGIQAEFIEKSNTGIIFDPDQIDQSATKMENLLRLGVSMEIKQNYLSQFSGETTSTQFVNIIKSLIGL